MLVSENSPALFCICRKKRWAFWLLGSGVMSLTTDDDAADLDQ